MFRAPFGGFHWKISSHMLMHEPEHPGQSPTESARNRFTTAQVMQLLQQENIRPECTRRVFVVGNSRSGKSELINLVLEAASERTAPTRHQYKGFLVGSTLTAVTSGMNRALVILTDVNNASNKWAFIYYNMNGFIEATKDNRERNNAEILAAFQDCPSLPAIFFFVVAPDVDAGGISRNDVEFFRVLKKQILPKNFVIVSNQLEDQADTEEDEQYWRKSVLRQLVLGDEYTDALYEQQLRAGDLPRVLCVGRICPDENGYGGGGSKSLQQRRDAAQLALLQFTFYQRSVMQRTLPSSIEELLTDDERIELEQKRAAAENRRREIERHAQLAADKARVERERVAEERKWRRRREEEEETLREERRRRDEGGCFAASATLLCSVANKEGGLVEEEKLPFPELGHDLLLPVMDPTSSSSGSQKVRTIAVHRHSRPHTILRILVQGASNNAPLSLTANHHVLADISGDGSKPAKVAAGQVRVGHFLFRRDCGGLLAPVRVVDVQTDVSEVYAVVTEGKTISADEKSADDTVGFVDAFAVFFTHSDDSAVVTALARSVLPKWVTRSKLALQTSELYESMW